jgi:hypothetical protein
MKDLEFQVSQVRSFSPSTTFKSFEKACSHAVSLACSHGEDVQIDVLAWTRAAARAWGGDAGVEIYNEDPEASVHERIIIKAESKGRIA